MKRSSEFDNILNECLEKVLINGEPIEQCLQSSPEQSKELEPLLRTALAGKVATTIQPSPEFKAKARYELNAAMLKLEQKKKRTFFSWQPRWATTAALILVFLFAGSGTVAASANSMPDETLYPVKLAKEQVQLALTPSDIGKAELYAKLADTRVTEIERLTEKDEPEKIEETTIRLSNSLANVANLSRQTTDSKAAMWAPAASSREGGTANQSPAPNTVTNPDITPMQPPSAGTYSDKNQPMDRRAKLKATMIAYATKHPESLRAMLKTAPESVKPALLEAIAASETGCQNAIEALN